MLIAFGNSMMTRYVYDSKTFRLSRMKSEGYSFSSNTFTPSAGTTRVDCAYEYDLTGNILKLKDRAPNCGVGSTNSLDRNFDYDALYRLLSATGREADTPAQSPPWNEPVTPVVNPNNTRAYTQMYDYDKMGNIISLQHIAMNGSFTRNFSYFANQNVLDEIIIGVNTYSFNFDPTGNMIQENSNRFFEWDYGNKMRLFKDQAGNSVPSIHTHYLYDSGGNRVKKFSRKGNSGTFEVAVYVDGVFQHRYERGASFARASELSEIHIIDNRSRIATVRSGHNDGTPFIKYNLEDHLGCSVSLDDNNTLIDREEYYPFGESSFGSYAKKRFRFCGKEKDDESGLYYYGARYYSAWTCRFNSIDPLFNKYPFYTPFQYSGNNSITFSDLDGKEKTNNSTANIPTNGQQQNQNNPGQGGYLINEVDASLHKAAVDNVQNQINHFEWRMSLLNSIKGIETVTLIHNNQDGSGKTIYDGPLSQTPDYLLKHVADLFGGLAQGEKGHVTLTATGVTTKHSKDWKGGKSEYFVDYNFQYTFERGGYNFVGEGTFQFPAAAFRHGTLLNIAVGVISMRITQINRLSIANKVPEVTLPKLGIQALDDVTNMTPSKFVSLARQYETKYREGILGPLSQEQADLLVKYANELGVVVRVDLGHPGTFWNMPHLNIGPSGYHVPYIPKP